MRRHAGIPVGLLVLLAGACTRTWVLPGDPDGGPPLDAISAGGASGKGGALGFGGRGGSSGTGGQPWPGCSPTQDKIGVEILTTDLMFVVDRTMSMGTKVGDTTRMTAVQTVVRNLVQANQYAVNFGYTEFPGPGPCPNACCLPSNAVPTQARNWPAIEMATRPCDFGPACVAQNDGRPIAPTLMAVAGLWTDNPPNDPRVVLIVDGPPGCQFDDPSQTCQPALDAVSMLSRSSDTYSAETYVVALGQDAQNDACLVKMALRGGTQILGISENGQDLVSALSAAIAPIVAEAAATSCTIELKSKPARLDLVAVFIRGQEVPFDPSGNKNGWNFQNDSNIRIQLHGSSCQDLQGARPSEVSARFGCAPCGEASPCHQ